MLWLRCVCAYFFNLLKTTLSHLVFRRSWKMIGESNSCQQTCLPCSPWCLYVLSCVYVDWWSDGKSWSKHGTGISVRYHVWVCAVSGIACMWRLYLQTNKEYFPHMYSHADYHIKIIFCVSAVALQFRYIEISSYFHHILRYLRMLCIVWSMVRRPVTRRLTRLQTMCNNLKYSKTM